MTTKQVIAEYMDTARQGATVRNLAEDPHILTSNMSDAFRIGAWSAHHFGWHRVVSMRPSRGYKWRLMLTDGERIVDMNHDTKDYRYAATVVQGGRTMADVRVLKRGKRYRFERICW